MKIHMWVRLLYPPGTKHWSEIESVEMKIVILNHKIVCTENRFMRTVFSHVFMVLFNLKLYIVSSTGCKIASCMRSFVCGFYMRIAMPHPPLKIIHECIVSH